MHSFKERVCADLITLMAHDWPGSRQIFIKFHHQPKNPGGVWTDREASDWKIKNTSIHLWSEFMHFPALCYDIIGGFVSAAATTEKNLVHCPDTCADGDEEEE